MSKRHQRPVLAIDLGGTKIAAGLVSTQGNVISSWHCLALASEGPDAVIRRLLALARKTVQRAGLALSDLSSVGMAAAGALDTTKGLVTASPSLPGWDNIPLQRILVEDLSLPVHLINDATAAALGEHRLGAGAGTTNLIYITVSTGIGGGIIVDGELHAGVNGCAGEIGHMTLDLNGNRCNCGNIGCLETLASGTAIARDAIKRLEQGQKSLLLTIALGRPEIITARTVARAARAGDLLAQDVIHRAARYIAIGLANLVRVFNPERIVVGGGVSRMGSLLFTPVRRNLEAVCFSPAIPSPQIIRAKFGHHSAVIGAALFAFEQESSPSEHAG